MADAHLEIWAGGTTPEVVTLDTERTSIGRDLTCDLALPTDEAVSRLHAVVERYGSGWCARDLGSLNGTLLNGARLTSERQLQSGDEIRVGSTHLVFRAHGQPSASRTLRDEEKLPRLTTREHEVLVALCRPLVGPEPFAQPATIAEMAAEFVVSEAAIKFHVANLYDKFEISDRGPSRRARLANEAVRRGAVTRADLEAPARLE
jgi:hypothetical protein